MVRPATACCPQLQAAARVAGERRPTGSVRRRARLGLDLERLGVADRESDGNRHASWRLVRVLHVRQNGLVAKAPRRQGQIARTRDDPTCPRCCDPARPQSEITCGWSRAATRGWRAAKIDPPPRTEDGGLAAWRPNLWHTRGRRASASERRPCSRQSLVREFAPRPGDQPLAHARITTERPSDPRSMRRCSRSTKRRRAALRSARSRSTTGPHGAGRARDGPRRPGRSARRCPGGGRRSRRRLRGARASCDRGSR